jgi:hypothetical protein
MVGVKWNGCCRPAEVMAVFNSETRKLVGDHLLFMQYQLLLLLSLVCEREENGKMRVKNQAEC